MLARRSSSTFLSRLMSRHSSRPLVTLATRPKLPSHFPPVVCCSSRRGAKRRTVLKAKELPQGAIPLPADAAAERKGSAKDDEDAAEKISVLDQHRQNMLKFPHCVVLTRVGGFYELYFEQAEIYGALLNLKVAKRGKDKPTPMAGFPFYQLDRYLKILVQDLGKHVAISEEFPNNVSKRAKSGMLFDRKVTRIITPGTLIDENFMDPFQSNYLLSIHVDPIGTTSEDPATAPGLELKGVQQAHKKGGQVGLAWIDLSSGDFFTQHTSITSLPSAVARIGPREVILDEALETLEDTSLISILKEDGHVITFSPRPANADVTDWTPMLEDAVGNFDPSAFTPAEISAGGSLLHYVRKQLLGSGTQLQMPVRHQAQDYMSIDRNSLRALEVRSTLRDGRYEGSLLHAVKRTVTKSGTRLLTQRIMAPSMSLPIINERLNLVSLMVSDEVLRERLTALLMRTFDTPRLVQKFTFGRGDADDLVELSKTIQVTSEIAATLEPYASRSNSNLPAEYASAVRALLEKLSLDGPLALARRIIDSIDEEGLSEQHRLEDSQAEEMSELALTAISEEATTEEDLKVLPKRTRKQTTTTSSPQRILSSAISGSTTQPFIMRQTASPTLTSLHTTLAALESEQETLQSTLRTSLSADTLTLKWTPSLGHICHVKGRDATRISTTLPATARSVSSSKSTRSFLLPEWSRLGATLDETRLRIRTEEHRVLADLRTAALRHLVRLRRNAAVLDELDVSCGFAKLAVEKAWTRPHVHAGTALHVIGGRHPVVEGGLLAQGRSFTPNDCTVGGPSIVDSSTKPAATAAATAERIWLITGPNMAGKSTFLRQNALLAILAQSGSFVPAASASIGLVDRLFSRVGSADNLYADQSTFMLEMVETASILRGATERSFVIMDEVGRGTTPEDGVAVGLACLDYLNRVNRCRTIFATHFHVLADMTNEWDGVACYCSDVIEEEGGTGWAYVHRLRKGVNRESHALKVARVAGLPEEAIETASRVLKELKGSQEDNQARENMSA